MENIIKEFFNLATKDRKILQALKNLAVKNGKFGLAAEIRNLELEKYPKAKLTNEKYEITKSFNVALRMMDINTDIKTSFKLLEIAKLFIEKEDSLDLETVAKIETDANEIFGSD